MVGSKIPAPWAILRIFRSRMGAAVGKQRTMVHEEHLLVTLHPITRDGSIDRVIEACADIDSGTEPEVILARGRTEAVEAELGFRVVSVS